MDQAEKRQLENRLIVQGLQGQPLNGTETAYTDFLESLAGFVSVSRVIGTAFWRI